MNQKYILLCSALIATALSSFIASIPIGLYGQAQVSAIFPTLFTPATITFSIWGLIYLSWIALGLYEAFGTSWVSKQNVYLLASAQILSSLWLIPSQYLYIYTSLVIMIAVLFLLSTSLILSKKEDLYFKITLQLFFGWILVACIANIHLTLVAYEIYYIPEILTYISILAAFAINAFVIKTYNAYIPSLVLIWSATGIILGQDNINTQIISGLSIIGIITVWVIHYITTRK